MNRAPLLALRIVLFGIALAHGDAEAAATSREGYLPVPGGKVCYRLSGADQTKPALIALHGGPGASHLCFEVLEPLANERPVVLYDQLGGGKSDHPKDLSLWTIERSVEELDQIIKGLGFKRVYLLGHSWGSIVVFEYVIRKHPANVAGLIGLRESGSAAGTQFTCPFHVR
jgi:proline iminopeptidase